MKPVRLDSTAETGQGGLFWVTLASASRTTRQEEIDRRCLYLLAPLRGDGRLDPARWLAQRGGCPVLRITAGQPILVGALRHRAGGAHGSTWIIDYDPGAELEDEHGFRLGVQQLVAGAVVPLIGPDGLRTFRVADVSSRIPAMVRRYLLSASRALPALPGRGCEAHREGSAPAWLWQGGTGRG